MKYKVKYYDVWYDEVSTYECKADNEMTLKYLLDEMFHQMYKDTKY